MPDSEHDSTVAAGDLSGADPTDLDALRATLSASDPDGELYPIKMHGIEIGEEALGSLTKIVSELARGDRVVLVADEAPMYRGGENLKEMVADSLGESFELERAVVGRGEGELHAEEASVAEAEDAVRGAGCVASVGSGTITDICKLATMKESIPFVAVQSAGSVDGFADDFSVLLKSGAKRTVSSRFPDALIIDLNVLSSAPPEMNAAGFGDILSNFTSSADWYLAHVMGMGATTGRHPPCSPNRRTTCSIGRRRSDGASRRRCTGWPGSLPLAAWPRAYPGAPRRALARSTWWATSSTCPPCNSAARSPSTAPRSGWRACRWPPRGKPCSSASIRPR